VDEQNRSPCASAAAAVVLSCDEVAAVLCRMQGEHQLLARLLYGAGLRITEALQLRVKGVDCAHGAIVGREGKGGLAVRGRVDSITLDDWRPT
jgi:site-specific recombinase XerD